MIPFVNAREMKSIDRAAIRRLGIPSLVLMENAGNAIVSDMESQYGPLLNKRILVVAGKGNNGGDGFVVARQAASRGAYVRILFVEDEAELTGDAATNFEIIKNLAGDRLAVLRKFVPNDLSRARFHCIIDAMFGTSFHGQVRGVYAKIIGWVNKQRTSTVISVDIPSGVDATTGEVSGSAINADRTVTFAFPKPGLYFGRGGRNSGLVSVADIHIPRDLAPKRSSRVSLVEEDDVRWALPRLAKDAHKHSVGKVFVLAGSKGMTGAALLCSMSAMRSGAGAVVLGIPGAVLSAVSRRTLEVMPLALQSTRSGSVALEALPAIIARMKWADVTLLGPGLSQDPATQELILRIVSASSSTLVIDADALNAVARDKSVLRKKRNGRLILTPHVGEFSRLSNIDPAEIENERVRVARAFAKKYRVVLVLKGAPTIIADPSGNVFVNPTGNPGMATAGSGDVLAGIIAAVAGQGNNPVQAAINGVFVHGKAGDMAREEVGEKGMIASDILNRVPAAMVNIEKGRNR